MNTQDTINEMLETRTKDNRNDIKLLDEKHTQDMRLIHEKIDDINKNIFDTKIDITKKISSTEVQITKDLSEIKQLFSKRQKLPLKFWISIILAIAAAITIIISSMRGEKIDHDLVRQISGIDISPASIGQ